MGRWAKASRSGGGPPSLIAMIRAEITSGTQITVTYNSAIDVANLALSVFQSSPSGSTNDTKTQVAPNKIRFGMDNTVTGDTSLVYSGTTIGVLRPQTIAIG